MNLSPMSRLLLLKNRVLDKLGYSPDSYSAIWSQIREDWCTLCARALLSKTGVLSDELEREVWGWFSPLFTVPPSEDHKCYLQYLQSHPTAESLELDLFPKPSALAQCLRGVLRKIHRGCGWLSLVLLGPPPSLSSNGLFKS